MKLSKQIRRIANSIEKTAEAVELSDVLNEIQKQFPLGFKLFDNVFNSGTIERIESDIKDLISGAEMEKDKIIDIFQTLENHARRIK